VPGTIDQDDAVGRREFLTQGEPHILQIATRAMNKNDSRLSMGIVRREPERYHMKPYTFHIDKFAGRGVCRLQSRDTKASRYRERD
jgi:hypothetical protein